MPPIDSVNRRNVIKGMVAGGAASLAGCIGDEGDTTGSSGGSEGLEVTAWSFGPNFPVLEEGAEYWNEENPHTIMPEEIDDGVEVWSSALQVQDGLPGIGLLHWPIYRSAARNGGLENINDVVMPNLDNLIDSAISAAHVDGNFYGFPHSINPTALIYNKNLFEEADLPGNPEDVFNEIETYDDLIQAGDQMQSETGADLVVHGSEIPQVPNALLTQYGGGFYNSDGDFEFDQQANVEVFRTLKDLQPYGANLGLFGNVIWEELRAENVASFIVPGWYIGFIRDNLEDMSGDWRIARLPAPEPGGPRGATEGGAPEAIPVANAADVKEVARDFGEFRNMSEVGYNQKLQNWIFPANSVDDPEVYEEPVEFFGGQTVFDQLGPTLEASPPQDSAPTDEIDQMYQEAYRLIMDEDEEIESTLSEAHDNMMSVINEADESRVTVEEIRSSA